MHRMVLVFVLTLGIGPAFGAERCLWMGWSTGSASFALGAKQRTYTLSLKGQDWRVSPFGWHAPGILSSRLSDNHVIQGMYHFLADTPDATAPVPAFSSAGAVATPFVASQARSAEKRLALRREAVGYPYVTYSGEMLTPLWTMPDLRSQGFSGYAVAWKVSPEAQNIYGRRAAKSQPIHLVAFNVRDGCMVVDVLLVDQSGKAPPREVVRSLLASVRVARTVEPLTREQVDRLASRRQRLGYERRPAELRPTEPRKPIVVGNGRNGILDELRETTQSTD